MEEGKGEMDFIKTQVFHTKLLLRGPVGIPEKAQQNMRAKGDWWWSRESSSRVKSKITLEPVTGLE